MAGVFKMSFCFFISSCYYYSCYFLFLLSFKHISCVFLPQLTQIAYTLNEQFMYFRLNSGLLHQETATRTSRARYHFSANCELRCCVSNNRVLRSLLQHVLRNNRALTKFEHLSDTCYLSSLIQLKFPLGVGAF